MASGGSMADVRAEPVEDGSPVPGTRTIADADPALINRDLAPVAPERRTWNLWHIAALWVGMAICIPTYTLASSLVERGWSWQAAVASVVLGNLIVLVPIVLNSHAGTRYGIPFPIFARSAFGV